MPNRGLKFPFSLRRYFEKGGRISPALTGESWRGWRPALEGWVAWVRQQPALDVAYVVGIVVVVLLAAYLLLTTG